MHCEKEQKGRVVLREREYGERVEAVERMVEELTGALEGQKRGRELLREYVPAVEAIRCSNDQQLQHL